MAQDKHQEEEEKPFLDDELSESSAHVTTRRKSQKSLIVIPWIVAAISWLVTIYLLLAQRNLEPLSSMLRNNNTSLNCETSFYPTDFEALRPAISYETRTFTGALYYNESTKLFIRNGTSDGTEYVGPPSEAIDAAWEALLAKEWTPMTEEESLPYQPRLKTFNAFYRFETDMFHSLHCVNEIRKRIDVEYYSQPEHAGIVIDQENWDRIHIDHCLDQIRQSVMCFGDLSPVPLYSWDGAPLGIGQGTEHTCRKWDPVRKWVDQRHLEMND